MTVTQAWENLEGWLDDQAPSIAEALLSGASGADLTRAEQMLGTPFPEPLSDFYRQHNGQEEGSPGLFDTGEFLSLDRMFRAREERLKFFDARPAWSINGQGPGPEPGIREMWWSPLWLPFCATGQEGFLCVDLDPAPGGNRGQIIRVWHDDPAREMRAMSLREWFNTRVQRIVRGDYVLSEDHHGLMLWQDL